MKAMNWMVGVGFMFALSLPLQAAAQEGKGDVVYVPTPQIVVDSMLKLAKVGPGDYIIDLGSGDGRIVITAVKKFGARGGFGVDLDQVLLKVSNDSARREGIADRVKFVDENLFETDLSQATVISTYLLPQMNEKLRPKILNLKPGTRVVVHDYHMGDWTSDDRETLTVPEKTVGNPGFSYVYMYIVPAKVAGHWRSEFAAGSGVPNWEFDFAQTFQMLNGAAQAGGQKVVLPTTKVEADHVKFEFLAKAGDASTRHEFSGTVKGDVIEGTLTLGAGAGQKRMPWVAKITQRVATAQ